MIVEPTNDQEFLHWLNAHAAGFVLNCHRKPTASYLKVHRASCPTIRSDSRSNYAGGDYHKVCAETKDELQSWALQQTGGTISCCLTCNP